MATGNTGGRREQVSLVVTDICGSLVVIKWGRDTTIGELIDSYCELAHKPDNESMTGYNGARVLARSDTLRSLQLKDGDVIVIYGPSTPPSPCANVTVKIGENRFSLLFPIHVPVCALMESLAIRHDFKRSTLMGHRGNEQVMYVLPQSSLNEQYHEGSDYYLYALPAVAVSPCKEVDDLFRNDDDDEEEDDF